MAGHVKSIPPPEFLYKISPLLVRNFKDTEVTESDVKFLKTRAAVGKNINTFIHSLVHRLSSLLRSLNFLLIKETFTRSFRGR